MTYKKLLYSLDGITLNILTLVNGVLQEVIDLSLNVPILESGLIPARYLPSYVDDIIEGYYYNNAFYEDSTHTQLITGETGKIYVDLSTDLTYRWSGSAYVEVSKSIITGVKGDAESNYRVGNVNLTAANIGLGNVANLDLSKAIKGITRSGTTFTYTCLDGTTGTFDQQDNNTTYSAGTGLLLTNTAFSVKLGYTTSGNNRAVQADANGNLYVTLKDDNTWTAWKGATASANGTAGYMPAPTKAQYLLFLRGDGTWVSLNNYSLPLAANGTRGGILIGYTQSGKNYPVLLSSEKAYVNVPWTDTTYSAGTGLSLTNTTFALALTKKLVTDALGYTPPTTDTNTHRPILVNGTEILGNNTTALNLKAGSNVTLTNSSGTVTIASTDTNTWRGIQDNLTSSTNTTESLSAKLGYLLANGSARDNTKLPLAGGTMTGAITMNTGTGIQMRYTNSLALTAGGTGDPWIYANGAPGYGIRYFEGNPDIMTLDANNNATDPSKAAISINYGGAGKVAIGGNNILHAGNSSVSLNGSTLTVKINGTSQSLTNTWPSKVSLLTNDSGYITGITKAMVTNALGYTPPTTDHTYNFSGISFTSGNSSTAEHNCNNITSNGVWYYTSNGPARTLGASTDVGALYSQAYSTSWVGQIAQDYRNGRLFVRAKKDNTWQNWLRVALYSEIPTTLPASDVYNWAKASTKPSYTLDEVSDGTTRKLSGKKDVLTAVSDPSASGTSLTFIKTISQNAQGVITPAKATVSTMGAASSSAAGTAGLVPAPAKGKQGSFLKGDGTWSDIPVAVGTGSVTIISSGSGTSANIRYYGYVSMGTYADAKKVISISVYTTNKISNTIDGNFSGYIKTSLSHTFVDSVTIGSTTITNAFLFTFGTSNPGATTYVSVYQV